MTMIFGYESTLKKQPLSLSRAHTKLCCHSDVSNINATLNINLIEVIPTTSSNDILYLLVLYVLSIINTMLKAFNSFTESGRVKNKSCTKFFFSSNLHQWIYMSHSSNIISYCISVLSQF